MEKHRIGVRLLKTNRILAVVTAIAIVLSSSSWTYATYTASDWANDVQDVTDIIEPITATTKSVWYAGTTLGVMGVMASKLGLPDGFNLSSLLHITPMPDLGGEAFLINKMKTTYEKNYATDHETLSADIPVAAIAWAQYKISYAKLKEAGAISFSGSADEVEKRIASQDQGYITRLGATSSDLYHKRIDKWQDIMFADIGASFIDMSVVKGLGSMAGDLSAIKKINDASTSAVGYMKLIQARNKALNFTGTGIVQLRAAVMRQTDTQFKFALDELQDDADETSSFAQAVSSWTSSGGGGGY
ncbi:hypothetical protein AGMMS49957_14590 [Synergistales bacterium]|nr:hypothetical protein AGMMS49957_14590 [Synergistales bacterium]